MMNYITSLLNANVVSRVKTIVILLPIVLFIIYQGGLPFTLTVIALGTFMAFEWAHMVGNKVKWLIAGAIYIALPITSMIMLRSGENGLTLVMFLLAVIWSTDIGAYCFGILIGGPKLMPSVSPKKTWSGAVMALLCAVVIASTFAVFTEFDAIYLMKLSAAISVLGQMGDLLESGLKRHFNIKDSSNLLPGHGGF
ncbi:MAG: phosphatidate cytidylyltransferase, partial [Alphaproteobacteria bacterium]